MPRRDARARAKGRAGRRSKRFAGISLEVMMSPACRTLSHATFRVLIAIAAQYSGGNNGRLTLPHSEAVKFGHFNPKTLMTAIAELIDRGLIVRTFLGGRGKRGPSRYALTWHRINECEEFDLVETRAPSDTWKNWQPVTEENEE